MKMTSSITKIMFLCKHMSHRIVRNFSTSPTYLRSVEPLSIPASAAESLIVSPKIENLVNEISKLTMIEASELSSALKKKLNLPDTPVMSFGAVPQGAAVAEEDEEAPKVVKTNYTVKLVKFDEAKKIALIKEIKGLLENMNLVQAKKFVESVPVTVKSDVSKDEADKLKEVLEKVGGEISIS